MVRAKKQRGYWPAGSVRRSLMLNFSAVAAEHTTQMIQMMQMIQLEASCPARTGFIARSSNFTSSPPRVRDALYFSRSTDPLTCRAGPCLSKATTYLFLFLRRWTTQKSIKSYSIIEEPSRIICQIAGLSQRQCTAYYLRIFRALARMHLQSPAAVGWASSRREA